MASTQGQINEVLGMMNECQRLAADVGNACFEGEVIQLRGLAAAFIARASQSMYSAGLLAQNGLNADAMSCGRTVVEMAIDFAYIALDPDARIARFMAYSDVHEFRLARNIDRHGGELPAEFLAELERRHNEFRENNPGTTGNWAGRKLNERAAESAQMDLYELSYADQCNATHSGPGTLEYAMVNVDGDRRVRFGRMTPSTHPMLLAHTAMIRLLQTVVTNCGLDRELGARAVSLDDRVRTLS